MNRFAKIISVGAVLGLMSSVAFAGPFGDAETALRAVYSQYRVALFATNSGNAERSAKALTAFGDGWAGITPILAAAPQYVDDNKAAATFAAVAELTDKANAAVAAGDLAGAHAVLEEVRDKIAALHRRNGIEGFSDRMNAYHAAMERVLGLDQANLETPKGQETAAELAGILNLTAKDIFNHPAPEAEAEAAKYAPLSEAFQASVDAYVAAVRAGDAKAIKAAIGDLKPAYARFFVEFG